MQYTHVLAVILSLICGLSAQAQQVVVAGYHYPPFMDQESKEGIYTDLLKAIAKETGFKFQWVYYPYPRLDKMFELKRVDIEVGSSPIWTQGKAVPGIYSQFFYTLKDRVIFKHGDEIDIQSSDDIKGLTVGIVRGYSFPQFKEAFDSGASKRIDAVNELKLFELLLHGRVKQVFASHDLFLYHQKNQKRFNQLVAGSVVGAYDIGIRIHPDKKELLTPINKALKKLKNNKVISGIFQRHLGKP